VLLIHDQPLADGPTLADIGDQWQQTIESFACSGGVVVVLVSDRGLNGPSGMPDFLRTSGLFPEVLGVSSATWHSLQLASPASAIAKSVATRFLALPSAVAFSASPIQPLPNSTMTAVVVDQPPNGSAPVVLHRTLMP
jgi:hypothetical protein